ncbi:MAG: hypothetical protein GFH27_549367n25 [Chloroflexi bacterium AL-W]|nr:hypothetical protein [Chloroflexi bacterium AL-W]
MKRNTLFLLVFGLMLLMVTGVASAQGRGDDDGNRRPFRDRMDDREGLITLIEEATGLTQQEIRQQWAQGQTLEDIIVANGGDIEAITAQMFGLWEARLSELLTREFTLTRPGFFGDGQLRESVEALTGLTMLEINERVMAGESLLEVLEDAGVDAETFLAEVTDNAQARLDELVATGIITPEQAELRLTNMMERLTAWLNGEILPRRGRGR